MRYQIHLLTTPTKEKFDETIKEILNRFEYLHLRQYGDFFEKLREKTVLWLEDWLKAMNFGNREINNVIPTVSNGIIVIGTILIILMVILMILFVKKMVRKDKKVKRILGEVIDEKTTTEGLHEKARKYKGLREYREALRYSFIALLFEMNERNLLYLDETQTNREIVYTLRKNNFKNIDLFENVTDLFNKIWYGHKIINEEIYESWEKMIAILENGVHGIEKE